MTRPLQLNALVLLLLIITPLAAWAELPTPPPGRYLEDGTWQPRNLQASRTIPPAGVRPDYPVENNWRTPEEVLSINWESEIRLSDTTGFNVFYGDILEAQNGYLHVVVSNAWGMEPYHIRSTDGGSSWGLGNFIWDESGPEAVFYQLFANGDTLTMPLSGGQILRCVYSSDAGQSWSGWNYLYRQGTTCSSVQLGDTIYASVALQDGRGQVYYSTNYGARWQDNLPYIPVSDAQALGATHRGLISLLQCYQEIYYSRFDFVDSMWTDTVMLSANFNRDSFNPLITSWADSNLLAMWLDYEYSPYPWTGDLLYRLSSDYGQSWGDIRQATGSHLVHDKDVVVRNDTIFLVYNKIVLDGQTNTEEIFFNLSSDRGDSWGEPVRLTNAPYFSGYCQIAIREGRIHVAFCDARDDMLNGNHKRPYYLRGRIVGPDGIEDKQEVIAQMISVVAYPNPFNSSTLITLYGLEGGKAPLYIYDVTGRLITTLNPIDIRGGDIKVVWDATDSTGKPVSSGIYFARVSTPQTQKTVKLLLLR